MYIRAIHPRVPPNGVLPPKEEQKNEEIARDSIIVMNDFDGKVRLLQFISDSQIAHFARLLICLVLHWLL